MSKTKESNFINNLIKATTKKDKYLKRFIDENLFPKQSNLSKEAIQKNIKELDSINDAEYLILRASATSFKESNEPAKLLTSAIGLFGLIAAIYSALSQVTGGEIISITANIVIVGFLLKIFRDAYSIYPTAVYFHSLVTNIKRDN